MPKVPRFVYDTTFVAIVCLWLVAALLCAMLTYVLAPVRLEGSVREGRVFVRLV